MSVQQVTTSVAPQAAVDEDVIATVLPDQVPAMRPAVSARGVVTTLSILFDGSLIWLSFCIAYYLRYALRVTPGEGGTVPVAFRDWIPFGIAFGALQLSGLIGTGFYRSRLGRDLLDETILVVRATLVGVGLVAILTTFLPVNAPSRLVIVYAWLTAITLLLFGRSLLYAALGSLHSSGWNTRRVLVAGTTPLSKMVLQNLLGKRNHGYQLIGFVQEATPGTPGTAGRGDFGRFKCLGRINELGEVIKVARIDEVIVALPATHHSEIAQICAHCEQAGVSVKLVPDLFEMSLSRVYMDHIAGIPLITVRRNKASRAALAIKRGMDIVIAGLLIILFSPILLLTAVAIKLDSRGPILHRQQRVGRNGVPFTFYKFRSMHIDADKRWAALVAQKGVIDARIFKDRHDPRRTRVGRFIRPLSIDELPQFFNILRGDMSLVGPRPPLPSEVEHYEPHHMKRLSVIGGLTGMWQVSGRSNIESFEEIVVMDTYYIDNWSLALDLKLLLRTVIAVLKGTGAF
ncbi:MAG TPA: sugar transferase [Chloroflexota bacterium]|nr:sugar transferase [Chloroflexota bacterium]